MPEGIIPGPNFKFQVRDNEWTRGWEHGQNWSEWYDVEPDETGVRLTELDGHLVVDGLGGSDEVTHQVRVVFLPEDEPTPGPTGVAL